MVGVRDGVGVGVSVGGTAVSVGMGVRVGGKVAVMVAVGRGGLVSMGVRMIWVCGTAVHVGGMVGAGDGTAVRATVGATPRRVGSGGSSWQLVSARQTRRRGVTAVTIRRTQKPAISLIITQNSVTPLAAL